MNVRAASSGREPLPGRRIGDLDGERLRRARLHVDSCMVPLSNRLSISFLPSGANSTYASPGDPGEGPRLRAPVGGHDVQSVPGCLEAAERNERAIR